MGVKMDKLCVFVWTQNGGICKTGCDMGMKIKMTQNVCEWGVSLQSVQQQYLHNFKSTKIVLNGGFRAIPFKYIGEGGGG